MDREKNNTDADCESYLRNLQQMIADLIGYVEVKAKGKGLDRAIPY